MNLNELAEDIRKRNLQDIFYINSIGIIGAYSLMDHKSSFHLVFVDCRGPETRFETDDLDEAIHKYLKWMQNYEENREKEQKRWDSLTDRQKQEWRAWRKSVRDGTYVAPPPLKPEDRYPPILLSGPVEKP